MTGVEPVDKKDHHCFQFTRCNRCVTFDYGPDCTPEQIDYNVNYWFENYTIFNIITKLNEQLKFFQFDIDENTDVVTCLDPESTCARAICECDKHTITTFASVIDFYDPINHAFNGFEPENDCTLRPKSGEWYYHKIYSQTSFNIRNKKICLKKTAKSPQQVDLLKWTAVEITPTDGPTTKIPTPISIAAMAKLLPTINALIHHLINQRLFFIFFRINVYIRNFENSHLANFLKKTLFFWQDLISQIID